MAQAIASMAAVLEGSLQHLGGSVRLTGTTGTGGRATALPVVRSSGLLTIRAQHQQAGGEPETSRRAVIGLVAAGFASGSFVQAVLADAVPIKVGPPPPPSGGLPGTLNSDQARDFDLPLKERFFIQALPPAAAAARAKESAQDILNVKGLIDKKAWPYVQNDLRLKASYLRFDLNTVIAAKSKDEKQSLKQLTGKLFQDISNLDHAAKIKSTPDAEKYYAEAVSSLNNVLSKLG